jgi:predicted transcriptional regulator
MSRRADYTALRAYLGGQATVFIDVSLELDQAEALNRLADGRGISRSQLVREAVAHFLATQRRGAR